MSTISDLSSHVLPALKKKKEINVNEVIESKYPEIDKLVSSLIGNEGQIKKIVYYENTNTNKGRFH